MYLALFPKCPLHYPDFFLIIETCRLLWLIFQSQRYHVRCTSKRHRKIETQQCNEIERGQKGVIKAERNQIQSQDFIFSLKHTVYKVSGIVILVSDISCQTCTYSTIILRSIIESLISFVFIRNYLKNSYWLLIVKVIIYIFTYLLKIDTYF